ncbi:MAG: histidine--tRNA ligase [Sedimentisphaerales bacterium]|nr:histidine--tRNA ligase [Sedimentisphaerales bacterium]
MKIPPVKGTRDFYPQEMAVRNFIMEGWKAASIRNGFEEYDGPIFEHLKMYQIKSGQEIVEQLFHLTDRGGRELAIRPEITPTLARMVNQQINALPRPIKWFSIPRLCRAERPQKGRLREFFQWNVDIIDVDDPRADAEVIFTSIDFLRSTGLTTADIQAKISSRRLLAALLRSIGIDENKLESLYALLDKKAKLPCEAFEEMLAKEIPVKDQAERIRDLMEVTTIEDIPRIVHMNEAATAALDELKNVFSLLDLMGISDYCHFDMGIVRGLAYYTGMVFEVHATSGKLRAICGGGRFDNLLKDFGGPSIAATGMGMGDCVLEILLREKGLLTDSLATRMLDYYICCLDDELMSRAIVLTATLRQRGYVVDCVYKISSLGKQLKLASSTNARQSIILGQELIRDNQLVLKDMQSGNQRSIQYDHFLSDLSS